MILTLSYHIYGNLLQYKVGATYRFVFLYDISGRRPLQRKDAKTQRPKHYGMFLVSGLCGVSRILSAMMG